MPAYALKDTLARQQKLRRLDEPHIAPLTAFVRRIRSELGVKEGVPWFDPDDAGTQARILLVFEAPGPQAVASSFISVENPDPTARNIHHLRDEAGIAPEAVLHWNVVPWFVQDETGHIRPVNTGELYVGARYLERLLKLLPNLRVIVAMGRKAQRGLAYVSPDALAGVQILHTWHPSGRVFNLRPHCRSEVLDALQEAATLAAVHNQTSRF
jgi:hypothetical protein